MPDDQELSQQDVADLQEISSKLPAGHPTQKKIAGVLSAQPTQFEKDRSGGGGFVQGLKDSLRGPSVTGAVTSGIPGLGIALDAGSMIANAPGRVQREFASEKGVPIVPRLASSAAAALAPAVGIDPDRLRAASLKADSAGIMGQVAIPSAMAAMGLGDALGMRDLVPSGEDIGRMARTPGKVDALSGAATKGSLKPGVKLASSVLGAAGGGAAGGLELGPYGAGGGIMAGWRAGPQIADALLPSHPDPFTIGDQAAASVERSMARKAAVDRLSLPKQARLANPLAGGVTVDEAPIEYWQEGGKAQGGGSEAWSMQRKQSPELQTAAREGNTNAQTVSLRLGKKAIVIPKGVPFP